jgi:hypothetical protein
VRTLTPDEARADATIRHSLSRPASSVEQVATDLIGLHNTTQVTPYLSVRARLAGFARADLDELMWGSWKLARIRAMRLTMFVFPNDLMEIAAAATRHIAETFAAGWLRNSQLSKAEFERVAAAVEAALADGPLTSRALRRALGVPQSVDVPGVVSRLCDTGRLVGGAPPRSWRSTIRQYHRWHDVLPDVDLHRWDEPAAIAELVARYVGSYGPVTIDDIAWWTGITKGRCRTAIAALDLEEVSVSGWPGPLYRTAGRMVGNELGAEVKALPLLDPYVQGYRDRIRLLDPGLHGHVWDGGGNAAATVVHRGRIIGVWQVTERPTETVRFHLFASASASTRRAAEADLAAAGLLYFDRSVDVVAASTMEPLSAEGGRSAAHPLDGRPHRPSRRPDA